MDQTEQLPRNLRILQNSPLEKEIESGIFILHMLELLMKFAIRRFYIYIYIYIYVFVDEHVRWNNFDVFLVATSGYEVMQDLVLSSDGSPITTFMHIGQLLKLAKALRLLGEVCSLSQFQLLLASPVDTHAIVRLGESFFRRAGRRFRGSWK